MYYKIREAVTLSMCQGNGSFLLVHVTRHFTYRVTILQITLLNTADSKLPYEISSSIRLHLDRDESGLILLSKG